MTSEQAPNVEWLKNVVSEGIDGDRDPAEQDWGGCAVVIDGEMFEVAAMYLGEAHPEGSA